MRVTRRNLLAYIGLGAAAAALTPAQSAGAVDPEFTAGPYWGNTGITPPERMLSNLPAVVGGLTITSDLSVSGNAVLSADGQEFRVSPMREHLDDMEFAYAQGRADGYNRGRLVEEARTPEELARLQAIWARGRCSYTSDCPCGDDMPAWSRNPEVVKAVIHGRLGDETPEPREGGLT